MENADITTKNRQICASRTSIQLFLVLSTTGLQGHRDVYHRMENRHTNLICSQMNRINLPLQSKTNEHYIETRFTSCFRNDDEKRRGKVALTMLAWKNVLPLLSCLINRFWGHVSDGSGGPMSRHMGFIMPH